MAIPVVCGGVVKSSHRREEPKEEKTQIGGGGVLIDGKIGSPWNASTSGC
jgi:hypothetical protein